MIFNITVHGQREPIGTAMVEPFEGDYTVVFYFKPGFVLGRSLKKGLEEQMKQMVRLEEENDDGKQSS